MALERLTTEINRVVAAPYPVSLKGLYDIVSSDDCGPVNLRTWAESKPCQVAPLAAAVVETLRQWPYATKLLTSFASIQAFRDAVLETQPEIQGKLIEMSLDFLNCHGGIKGGKEYLDACIAMLSTPLPESFMMPTQLPTLVLALIEAMVRQPTPDTIVPLYKVISGTRENIFDILPDDTMSRFQSECTRILRKLDDHFSSLLCLAMFARIASADARLNDQRPGWHRSICQFFDATRGLKTLDLVFLRVILACSSTVEFPGSQSVDCILLAKEVCDVVDPSQKNNWIQSGKVKIVKLCEKILKADHDPTIQMLGLAFLASLLPAELIPGEIVKLAQRKLLSDDVRKALLTVSPDLLSILVEKLLARFDDAAVAQCIGLIQPSSEHSLSETLIAECLLAGAISACKESDIARTKVESSLSQARNWISTDRPLSHHDHLLCRNWKHCPVALSLSKHKLSFELTALYLDVFFSSPVPKSRAETILPNILKMLDNLKQSVIASHSLSSAPTLMRQTLSPLSDSARLPGGSHDWRTTLLQALTNQAGQTYETIINHMREVCHDLEHRCEHVEEPLRRVTSKLEALAAEHEKTKSHCEALQRKDSQSAQLISELEGEKDKLKQHADSLASQLRSAQEEVQRARKDAEIAVREMKTRARDAELDYSATVTAKDDAIEELQLQLEDLQGEQEELRGQLGASEGDRRSLTEQLKTLSGEKSEALTLVNTLRDETAALRLDVEGKARRTLEQDGIMKAMLDENVALKAELSEHQSKLFEKVAELEKVQTNFAREKDVYTEDVRYLRKAHAEEITMIQTSMNQMEKAFKDKIQMLETSHNEKISQMQSCHREETSQLETSLKSAKSKATKALASRDQKIEDLKNQVTILERERAAKAREFAKAQEYSNRLMAVFKPDRLPTRISSADQPRDKPTSSSRSVKPQNQRVELDLESPSMKNTQDKLLADVSFSSIVSCNVGPTPKRRRSTHQAPRTPGQNGGTNNDSSSPQLSGGERSRLARSSTNFCLTPVSREPLSDIAPGASNSQNSAQYRRASSLSFLSTPEIEVGRGLSQGEAGRLDENGFSRLDFVDDDTFLSTDTL